MLTVPINYLSSFPQVEAAKKHVLNDTGKKIDRRTATIFLLYLGRLNYHRLTETKYVNIAPLAKQFMADITKIEQTLKTPKNLQQIFIEIGNLLRHSGTKSREMDSEEKVPQALILYFSQSPMPDLEAKTSAVSMQQKVQEYTAQVHEDIQAYTSWLYDLFSEGPSQTLTIAQLVQLRFFLERRSPMGRKEGYLLWDQVIKAWNPSLHETRLHALLKRVENEISNRGYSEAKHIEIALNEFIHEGDPVPNKSLPVYLAEMTLRVIFTEHLQLPDPRRKGSKLKKLYDGLAKLFAENESARRTAAFYTRTRLENPLCDNLIEEDTPMLPFLKGAKMFMLDTEVLQNFESKFIPIPPKEKLRWYVLYALLENEKLTLDDHVDFLHEIEQFSNTKLSLDEIFDFCIANFMTVESASAMKKLKELREDLIVNQVHHFTISSGSEILSAAWGCVHPDQPAPKSQYFSLHNPKIGLKLSHLLVFAITPPYDLADGDVIFYPQVLPFSLSADPPKEERENPIPYTCEWKQLPSTCWQLSITLHDETTTAILNLPQATIKKYPQFEQLLTLMIKRLCPEKTFKDDEDKPTINRPFHSILEECLFHIRLHPLFLEELPSVMHLFPNLPNKEEREFYLYSIYDAFETFMTTHYSESPVANGKNAVRAHMIVEAFKFLKELKVGLRCTFIQKSTGHNPRESIREAKDNLTQQLSEWKSLVEAEEPDPDKKEFVFQAIDRNLALMERYKIPITLLNTFNSTLAGMYRHLETFYADFRVLEYSFTSGARLEACRLLEDQKTVCRFYFKRNVDPPGPSVLNWIYPYKGASLERYKQGIDNYPGAVQHLPPDFLNHLLHNVKTHSEFSSKESSGNLLSVITLDIERFSRFTLNQTVFTKVSEGPSKPGYFVISEEGNHDMKLIGKDGSSFSIYNFCKETLDNDPILTQNTLILLSQAAADMIFNYMNRFSNYELAFGLSRRQGEIYLYTNVKGNVEVYHKHIWRIMNPDDFERYFATLFKISADRDEVKKGITTDPTLMITYSKSYQTQDDAKADPLWKNDPLTLNEDESEHSEEQ